MKLKRCKEQNRFGEEITATKRKNPKTVLRSSLVEDVKFGNIFFYCFKFPVWNDHIHVSFRAVKTDGNISICHCGHCALSSREHYNTSEYASGSSPAPNDCL
jgi:hypothetical protein